MEKQNSNKTGKVVFVVLFILASAFSLTSSGCNGYSNESLFSSEVGSVYVEMFDSKSFRRGIEYGLTDAVVKRIEANTPYKVVSSMDRADTVLSGMIVGIGGSVLSSERKTGRALENEVTIDAEISWKSLKTGELLIDSQKVQGSASYSQWQNQGFDYASSLAANNLAVRIVELMEKQW